MGLDTTIRLSDIIAIVVFVSGGLWAFVQVKIDLARNMVVSSDNARGLAEMREDMKMMTEILIKLARQDERLSSLERKAENK